MNTRREGRLQRKIRVRAKINGTKERPRMSIFRSNTSLYVQLIDDQKRTTICSGSKKGSSVLVAKQLGSEMSIILKKHGIKAVVCDRSGYRYHGAVKALVDTVREGGIII